LRDLDQAGLAEKMRHLRHEWTQATVSEVERGERNVTVDELAGLAIAFGVALGELLDPDRLRVSLDVGMTGPLRKSLASAWARGLLRVWVEGSPGAEKYGFEETMLTADARMVEILKVRTPEEPE
jgi:transcriptional regulator with XRE-family HTH domain